MASQVKHMQQHCVIYFHYHHLLQNVLVSVVPLTPPSLVLLCSSNKRKKLPDVNQANLLLCTYLIHKYSLLKENTKRNFEVQAVIRSWNLRIICHHCKIKISLKEDLKEVSLESFTYLVVDGNTLTVNPVQDQDGDLLITSAAAKKGILYIAGPSHVS